MDPHKNLGILPVLRCFRVAKVLDHEAKQRVLRLYGSRKRAHSVQLPRAETLVSGTVPEGLDRSP